MKTASCSVTCFWLMNSPSVGGRRDRSSSSSPTRSVGASITSISPSGSGPPSAKAGSRSIVIVCRDDRAEPEAKLRIRRFSSQGRGDRAEPEAKLRIRRFSSQGRDDRAEPEAKLRIRRCSFDPGGLAQGGRDEVLRGSVVPGGRGGGIEEPLGLRRCVAEAQESFACLGAGVADAGGRRGGELGLVADLVLQLDDDPL